jgi:thymidylate synthase ThyX
MKEDAQFEIRRYANAIFETVEDDLNALGLTRDMFEEGH